jgi:formylglycine-generating enzyme required for sulfatase activity
MPLAFGQSSLPDPAQADVLKTQIVEVAGKGDAETALKKIDDYRSLNVPMPATLLFIEAKLSAERKDYRRAQAALEEYFKSAKSDDANYQEGITLYPTVKRAASQMLNAPEEAGQRKPQAQAGAATHEYEALIKSILKEMVTIPAGEFQMGDLSGRGESDEKPVHTVHVKALRLAKYEVTFDQFDVYAKATGKPLPSDQGWGRGKRPVINVNWENAQAFIAWLNQVSGLKFRLLSEAEWEYAARGGSTTDYPWGDEFNASHANGNTKVETGKTIEVGHYPPNAFGLYDTIGNVWEWMQDCPNPDYATAPTDGSAWMTGKCTSRVLRGGSWVNDPGNLRVSNRSQSLASLRLQNLGFRLAQDP